MFNYDKISNKKAIRFLRDKKFNSLWYNNLDEFIHDVNTFGLYNNELLIGVIAMEDWGKFTEPHIFCLKEHRGRNLLKVCRKFLKNRIFLYKLLIGRVERSRKDVMSFASLSGFKRFKEDDKYIYFGANHESI